MSFTRSILPVVLAAAIMANLCDVAYSQTPMSLGAPLAAAGGGYAVGKAVGTCAKHKIPCMATIAVGAGYAYKSAKSARKLDADTPQCSSSYVSLFRAVGSLERTEIWAIQRYVLFGCIANRRDNRGMGLRSIGMITYSIEFTADVEMTGPHSHPPVLTTRIQPNLVVADNYCLCFITETTPSEGIKMGAAARSKLWGCVRRI